MALQIARREVKLGQESRFESCTGAIFTGKALREGPSVGPRKSVIVEVGGTAYVTGEAKFRFDDEDPAAGKVLLFHRSAPLQWRSSRAP